MLIDRLTRWLDLPSHDFRRNFNLRWEYEKADSTTAWDNEPDFNALSAALAEYEDAADVAFARLRELAQAGSVVAMAVVGESYYWGSGTAVDPIEAENWLRKAYEHGSRRGLLSYGRVACLRNDLPAAERIFSRGASAGWPEAKYRLADVMWRRAKGTMLPTELWALVEAAATAGHPFARLWLGRVMGRGPKGLTNMLRGVRMVMTFSRDVQRAWDMRTPIGEVETNSITAMSRKRTLDPCR